jgi:hypothetical protein
LTAGSIGMSRQPLRRSQVWHSHERSSSNVERLLFKKGGIAV